MARELVKRTTTIVSKGRRDGEGDPMQGKLRAALKHVARLTPAGYVEAIKTIEDGDLTVHVFKKLGAAGMNKCGEYQLNELEPETVEGNILQAWGVGMYQLRPVYQRAYCSPSSVMFKVSDGADDSTALVAAPAGADVDAVLGQTMQRLGHLATAKKLKELADGTSEETTDVKEDRLVAILQAMKPDNTIMLALLDQSNARAAAAEARAQEMLRMMMDNRDKGQSGALPILGDLLKNVKPEVWQTLLNPAGPVEPASWVDSLVGVVREIAPSLREFVPLLITQMRTAGVPVVAQPALPAGSRHPQPPQPATPAPVDAGGPAMAIPLDEEQTMAKGFILEFLKANDMENAFAALAAFPGFAPGPAGAMPMGDFIISRIDPAVNPKIYIPQLLMLFPEAKTMLPAVEAFVRFCQKKIMEDDEAARADDRGPGNGALDPPPTGRQA